MKLGAASPQPQPVVVFLPDRQAFPAKSPVRTAPRTAPSAEALWAAASAREDDTLTPTWQASVFTFGKATADAIVAHARAGGSQKIAALIGAAGQFELLAKEVGRARARMDGQVRDLEPRLAELAARFQALLSDRTDTPLSSVDLEGMNRALEIIDRGTDVLYTSAYDLAEQQREALRPEIPAGAECVDELHLAEDDTKSMREIARRLLALVTDHAMYSDLNGERMIAYPSDKRLPDPVGAVFDRFRQTMDETQAVTEPIDPDDALHGLRAQVAVQLDTERVWAEVALARGTEPRPLSALLAAFGDRNQALVGQIQLRHPVEIDRWVGHLIDSYVRDYSAEADAEGPESLADKARAALALWIEQPPATTVYAATLPYWRAALARRAR